MVVIPRLTMVNGTPITEILPPPTIARLIDRTIKGGAEIVSLLKTGSAFYAPGAAAAQMVDAVMRDRKRILPCAVRLEGEYGISGVVVGVPVKLGANGVERIYELRLTESEATALRRSADAVRGVLQAVAGR